VKVASDPGRRLFFEGIGEVERPLEVTPELTGWDAPSARAYQYRMGQVVDGDAEDDEMVMVLLWGEVALSATGIDERVCVRRDPFTEPATVLYLPPGGSYRADVRADAHVLYCRAPGSDGVTDRPARLLVAAPCQSVILSGATSARLRMREDVIRAGTSSMVPLGAAGRAIIYHRFATPDGSGTSFDGVRVVDGDAIVRTGSAHPLLVSGAADLLAVTVTVAETHTTDKDGIGGAAAGELAAEELAPDGARRDA
jgi:KduI/IolB family